MTSEESTKICPFCGESIKQVATVCRYCHSKLDGSQPEVSEQPDSEAPAVVRSRSISLKRISVALLVLLSVGGGAGYWFLRQNPSCEDSVGTVQEILLENVLKPFSSPQRAAIQKALSITINNVSQRSRSEEGRLCSATVAFASKVQEFARFTDLDMNSTSVLKLLPQWDVVAHKMEAAIEFNVKRDGDSVVVSARGPALLIAEPLLQAASDWDQFNQAAVYFNRLTQDAQRSSGDSGATQSKPTDDPAGATNSSNTGNSYLRSQDGKQVQTSLGSLKIVCPREEGIGCAEPLRVLWRDKELYRSDVAQSFEFLQENYSLQDGHAVILAESSGGTACPALYAVILIEPTGGATITELFGSCSDLPRIKAETNALVFTFPTANGSASYRFADRKITESRQ